MPVRCHSCCTLASQRAGSSLHRECKKVKKWRGKAEDAGKIALKKRGERANAQIDKRTAFMLCGQGTVPAGLPEAIIQLQKSIPHSLTPVPCWWHLGVSVLCIYMHSRVVETAAASTLDMESPFVLLSSRSASEQSLNKQPLCLHMSL